jgi:23S rRNA pseudouridine1911/1915/1917 synthase
MKRIQAKVKQDSDGMRLDLFWVKADVGLSRRKIRQIIDIGGAYQNRKRVRMASRQVKSGDEVLLEYHPDSLVVAEAKEIDFTLADIVFEDVDLIAVNKPPLMPSQATRSQSVFHVEVCLKKLLERSGRKAGKLMICHRLDKETTGIILVAKSAQVAEFVMNQFREKTIKKTYWALCHGIPREGAWQVENFLSEIDKKTGMVRSVRAGGKPATTRFKTLHANDSFGVSLVECYPETGRSHQIRVHLAEMGLPILGDKKYGASPKQSLDAKISALAATHHMLHAKRLQFRTMKDSREHELAAELPLDFKELLNALGFS